MPVRKRTLTRRQALDECAQAWLDGEKHPGVWAIFKYSSDERQALWDQHGDKEAMHWDQTMFLPQPIDN